jgi:GTPase SAR1 family protein
MKTEISRFCVSCADTVGSLPGVLDAAVAQFEHRSDALGRSLAILNDTRAHLRSLTDKLKGQQAYLLIFGPLKSGKSTLMNAISGSYVSEVTSLPGYPCLVFVRDNTTPRYSVTRYNGRESAFPDKAVLADVVMEAHHALAQQIRTTEARGESFDPRTTFPEAIRRIDIQVPIPALADSATVLVDTPGLYSRMNFGYDVLTREFRDSAACAVFVVKTDNLFLEQVFAEFNQLLGIFSRIFIVVNVDAGKRDLAPDGTLRPSAESEHPERVIEAFTTLSMAGPLREAYEAGRVRIHAVDLLGAASSFLAGGAEASKHRAAFDAFQQDLTEYLNSSDTPVNLSATVSVRRKRCAKMRVRWRMARKSPCSLSNSANVLRKSRVWTPESPRQTDSWLRTGMPCLPACWKATRGTPQTPSGPDPAP